MHVIISVSASLIIDSVKIIIVIWGLNLYTVGSLVDLLAGLLTVRYDIVASE